MSIFSKKSALASLLLFSMLAVQASDLAKEQRWREQVVDSLLDGDEVTLNDGTNDFLGILTEPDTPKATGIIVLHGIGIHPNWDQVVKPIRVGMAEQGWTTLALQLPILPNEAEDTEYTPLMPEAAQRIATGVRYFNDMGIKDVIIVAHSLGAKMAVLALANNSAHAKAIVVIGIGPSAIPYMPKVSIPMLDLYGSEDLPDVVANAGKRAEVMAGKNYTQKKVDAADHFFNDQDNVLLETVIEWVDSQ